MFLIVVLLFFTAFFVATEFAIVKVRKTKMVQLENEGVKSASRVLAILDNLDGYLSACQLGITITALGLGWIGEPAIADALSKVLHSFHLGDTMTHTISFIIAFAFITFIHVVLGELAPKSVAIQKSEKISLAISKPLMLFYKLLFPFIVILNGTANLLVKGMGMKTISEEENHSEEEIKMILSNSSEIEPDEQIMLNRIFNFHDRKVREIMVHRTDIDCIYLEDDIEENLAFVKESSHSRFPVCREDKDDIIGYINVKDLYNQSRDGKYELQPIIREVLKIYETTPLNKALKQLQMGHHQMAIVIDEFAGVSGIVTLEDIVEEIVGEIQDEFDNEVEPFQKTTDGIIIEASVLIEDVNQELGTNFENVSGVDSIGGLVLCHLDTPPKVGKEIVIDNQLIQVLKTDEHRIHLVKILKRKAN